MNWMLLLVAGLLFQLNICNQPSHKAKSMPEQIQTTLAAGTVQQIALPEGYVRCAAAAGSFTDWLRELPLKQDKTVYLYNGKPKINQLAQFAVLNVPVGNKDLQQCADAVMRLRASYLYDYGRFDEIVFYDNNRQAYRYGNMKDSLKFEKYLEKTFAHCGSLSLQNQLKSIRKSTEAKAGDVLIQGGSPGHAVIVLDIAENKNGQKIYLLAQSYMPAQDIHILKNLANAILNPWYTISDQQEVITPEWRFAPGALKTW